MKLPAAALLVLLAGCANARSQPMSGNEFLDLDRAKPLEAARFMQGLRDGLTTMAIVVDMTAISDSARQVFGLCIPEAVTLGQFHDVLLASLHSDPQNRHKPVAFLAYQSSASAWPCPSK